MDGPKFSPTNAQRAALGLLQVEPGWEWVRFKDSGVPGFESWACIAAGDNPLAWSIGQDPRSPLYRKDLEAICAQFGLDIDPLPIIRK